MMPTCPYLPLKPTEQKLAVHFDWIQGKKENTRERHTFSLPHPLLFIAQTIKLKRPSLACCYSAGPQVALPASQTGVPYNRS